MKFLLVFDDIFFIQWRWIFDNSTYKARFKTWHCRMVLDEVLLLKILYNISGFAIFTDEEISLFNVHL